MSNNFFFSATNKKVLKDFINEYLQKQAYYQSDYNWEGRLDSKMAAIYDAYAATYSDQNATEFIRNMNNRVVEEFLPDTIENMKRVFNQLEILRLDKEAYKVGANSEVSASDIEKLYMDSNTIDRYVRDRATVIPIPSDRDVRKEMALYSLNGMKSKKDAKKEPELEVFADNATKNAIVDLYNEAYNQRDKKVEYYLYVDSRDRDLNAYPYPNYYIVNLLPANNQRLSFNQNNVTGINNPPFNNFINQPPNGPNGSRSYENILSIEITELTLPFSVGGTHLDPLAGQPYILLIITEFIGNYDGTDTLLLRNAVKIVPDKVRGSYYTFNPNYRLIFKRSNLGQLKRITMQFVNPFNPTGAPGIFPGPWPVPLPAPPAGYTSYQITPVEFIQSDGEYLNNIVSFRITCLEAEPDFVK